MYKLRVLRVLNSNFSIFESLGVLGVLGCEIKHYNTCNSFSLVKYFFLSLSMDIG